MLHDRSATADSGPTRDPTADRTMGSDPGEPGRATSWTQCLKANSKNPNQLLRSFVMESWFHLSFYLQLSK